MQFRVKLDRVKSIFYIMEFKTIVTTHEPRGGGSNRRQLDYLLYSVIWLISKKTSSLCITDWNPQVNRRIPLTKGQQRVFPCFEVLSWWRHQMETFSTLLAIWIHRSPVNSPHKWPVTRSFDVFFDLRLNKRLSKQSLGWWFEKPSRPLWRYCNVPC